MRRALQIRQHLSPDLLHKPVFNLVQQSAGWRTPSVFIFRLVFSVHLNLRLRGLERTRYSLTGTFGSGMLCPLTGVCYLLSVLQTTWVR